MSACVPLPLRSRRSIAGLKRSTDSRVWTGAEAPAFRSKTEVDDIVLRVGGSFHPRHLDLFDLQLSGDRKRIDGLRLHGRRRGQENGGHRNREDSDGNLAPKARESGVTLATPAPEARSTLCLDLFHPVKIKVINNIGLGSSVAELRPVGVQR